MKNPKKSWASTPKQKRKDSFPNLSQYDSWWNNQENTTETHRTRRRDVKILCKKIVSGNKVNVSLFPVDQWKRFPLYY